MNINIKATSLTLTPDISNYITKRLDAVTKFFRHDSSARCEVEIGRTSAHHKNGEVFRAEVHISAKGEDLYASAEEEDIYRAIDAVRDEILREARSSKAKKISLVRRSGMMVKNLMKGMWPGSKRDF